MSIAEQKENIMQLPLPQRTVAVALKHIFDEIKKIEEQQGEEIQKVHQSFIGKFKAAEDQASSIIKGAPINLESLKQRQKYFSTAESGQVEELCKNNKGIEAYWLTVFQNYFTEDLALGDKEIAVAITNISTNITEDKLELTFEIDSNQWLAPGTFSRRFILQEGQPTRVEGDKVRWLKKKPDCILAKILDGCQSQEQLLTIFPLVGQIINEMVPYSLQFYLGMPGDEQFDEEGDEEEDQEEGSDEQEERGPEKKIKE